MYTRHDDVRRNFDGSIDFDFYRRRAGRLRAEAMRDVFAARIGPMVKPAFAVGIIVAVLLSMPSDEGLGPTSRQPGRDPVVASQAKDPAARFRAFAADLLALAGLHRPEDRRQLPDAHP